MDISNKKLKKAFTLYQTGRLKEALSLCEKFLQKESCNEEALELEGKILKDLGRLEEAIITWKINAEYNDNEDAKNSLSEIDEDKKQHTLSYENLSQLISEATNEHPENNNLIEAPRVQTPLSIEEPTKAEDFNTSIVENSVKVEEKVEIKIEEPIKKKTVESAEKKESVKTSYIKEETKNVSKPKVKVTETKTTKKVENSKPVEEFIPSNIESRNSTKSSKKIIYTSVGVIIIAIAIIGAIYASTTSNNKKVTKPPVQSSQSGQVVKPTPAPTPEAQPKKLTDEQGQALIDQLTTAADANSIDTVNNLLQKNPLDVIPEKYVADYNNALGFMENQGVNYYYEKEVSAYNNKQYEATIDYFNQAKPYYKNFKAAPTMLFYTASSYEALNQKEKAMETYKEYLKVFPNSEYYTEECLYNLAMYYNQTNDITQAKQYASELSTNYPNSMYNNTNIKGILKK